MRAGYPEKGSLQSSKEGYFALKGQMGAQVDAVATPYLGWGYHTHFG